MNNQYRQVLRVSINLLQKLFQLKPIRQFTRLMIRAQKKRKYRLLQHQNLRHLCSIILRFIRMKKLRRNQKLIIRLLNPQTRVPNRSKQYQSRWFCLRKSYRLDQDRVTKQYSDRQNVKWRIVMMSASHLENPPILMRNTWSSLRHLSHKIRNGYINHSIRK